MSENTTIDHHFVFCDGAKLHYVEAKPAQFDDADELPTLVFLHGFPEFWQAWEQQLNYFGGRFKVIVPDLPGYNLSEAKTEQDFYQIPNLVKVMSAFIQAVSPARPVTLVAHDWGGAIAWVLAAFQPQLLDGLVIINAAHPSTFTRELARNPKQRQSSSYIHDLRSPGAAERLAADDFKALQHMMMEIIAGDPLDAEQKTAYREAWAQPGALDAMLNYYRAMPQTGQQDEDAEAQELRIPHIRIDVPTLVLWGDQDTAFVPEVLDGLENYVPDLRVVHYPTSTHWLHHEKPLNVSKEIEGFMAHKD